MGKHWKLKRQAVVSETNFKTPARYILWAPQKRLSFWELTRTRNDLWTCRWTLWDSALVNNLFQHHRTFFFLCYICELVRSHCISHKILLVLLPLSFSLPSANSHGCFKCKDVGFSLLLKFDSTSVIKFTAVKMNIYMQVSRPGINRNSLKSCWTGMKWLQMFVGKTGAVNKLRSPLVSISSL